MFKKITAAVLLLMMLSISYIIPVSAVQAEKTLDITLNSWSVTSVRSLLNDPEAIVLSSSERGVLEVSSGGVITPVKAGKTTVYAFGSEGNVNLNITVNEVVTDHEYNRAYFCFEGGKLTLNGEGRAMLDKEFTSFYIEELPLGEIMLKQRDAEGYLGYNESGIMGVGEEYINQSFRIVYTAEGKTVLASKDASLAVSSITDELLVMQPIGNEGQSITLKEDDDFIAGWPSSDTFMVTGLDYYFSSNKPHNNGHAVDIGDGKEGHDIIAIEDGVVIDTDNTCPHVDNVGCNCNGGSGNYVFVKHENGYVSKYIHMQLDGIVVKKGDEVRKGDLLGMMGSSGRSSGNHVHLALYNASGEPLYVFDHLMEDETILDKVYFTGTGPENSRYYELIKGINS